MIETRTQALRPAPRRSFAAFALVLAACGNDAAPEPAATPAETVPDWARPVEDVLDAKLQKYGIVLDGAEPATPELRTDKGTLPEDVEAALPTEERPDPDAGLEPELVALREELLELALSQPRMLPVAIGDAEAAGESMPTVLAAGLRGPERTSAELRVLVDLSRSTPSADVARALTAVATVAEDADLRGYAATAIQDHLDAPGSDAVLPALVKRLKYERDEGVLRWIGETIDAVRARLAESGVPSDALLGECWRLIHGISGEHFQLRGVDDARFVLARLGPWAAAELAEALGDDDPYVRLYAAQVLERMEADGAPAVDSLTRALADRNSGVAGAAAEALGVVAGDGARDPLLTRLAEDPPHEARVAIVRALAALPGGAPVDALRGVFANGVGVDLKLAAAIGLLRSGETAEVVPWLAGQLESRIGDPAGAEAALDDWLRAGGGPDGVLEAWVALGPKGSVVHGAEEVRARRAARAALFSAGDSPGETAEPLDRPGPR